MCVGRTLTFVLAQIALHPSVDLDEAFEADLTFDKPCP